jgi:hypothetical protein
VFFLSYDPVCSPFLLHSFSGSIGYNKGKSFPFAAWEKESLRHGLQVTNWPSSVRFTPICKLSTSELATLERCISAEDDSTRVAVIRVDEPEDHMDVDDLDSPPFPPSVFPRSSLFLLCAFADLLCFCIST